MNGRRLGLIAMLVVPAMLAVSTPAAHADAVGFSSGAGGGLISYDLSPTGVLTGTSIPIIHAFGSGSAPQTVTGYACGPAASPNSSACGFLTFTTGTVISQTPSSLSFGGGQLTITGSVGGSALVTLLAATFSGPITVTALNNSASGRDWILTGKISVTSLGSAIVALFPNAASIKPGSTGNIRITFSQEPGSTFIGFATNPTIFITTWSGSNSGSRKPLLGASATTSPYGPSSPVPEPGSIVLLGSGLVAVRNMLRRRKAQA